MTVQEHHAHRRILGGAPECGGHLRVHVDRDGVLLLGPIDLDAQNAIGDVGDDQGFHSWLPRNPLLIVRRCISAYGIDDAIRPNATRT